MAIITRPTPTTESNVPNHMSELLAVVVDQESKGVLPRIWKGREEKGRGLKPKEKDLPSQNGCVNRPFVYTPRYGPKMSTQTPDLVVFNGFQLTKKGQNPHFRPKRSPQTTDLVPKLGPNTTPSALGVDSLSAYIFKNPNRNPTYSVERGIFYLFLIISLLVGGVMSPNTRFSHTIFGLIIYSTCQNLTPKSKSMIFQ